MNMVIQRERMDIRQYVDACTCPQHKSSAGPGSCRPVSCIGFHNENDIYVLGTVTCMVIEEDSVEDRIK